MGVPWPSPWLGVGGGVIMRALYSFVGLNLVRYCAGATCRRTHSTTHDMRARDVTRPAETPHEPETLTVPEAAALLGIGRDLAYRAAARGDIPTLRIGRRLVVPRAQLERLLNGRPATQSTEGEGRAS